MPKQSDPPPPDLRTALGTLIEASLRPALGGVGSFVAMFLFLYAAQRHGGSIYRGLAAAMLVPLFRSVIDILLLRTRERIAGVTEHGLGAFPSPYDRTACCLLISIWLKAMGG